MSLRRARGGRSLRLRCHARITTDTRMAFTTFCRISCRCYDRCGQRHKHAVYPELLWPGMER